MSDRVIKLGGQVREVLSEALVRGEVKDPRVRGAGIITITHVRLTGDLREVTALFMVHGAGEGELERVRGGLDSAAGYLRRLIGKELRLRTIPTLSFEVDRVFDQESRVEKVFAELAAEKKPDPTEG
jgi:ribosome-binding factor A